MYSHVGNRVKFIYSISGSCKSSSVWAPLMWRDPNLHVFEIFNNSVSTQRWSQFATGNQKVCVQYESNNRLLMYWMHSPKYTYRFCSAHLVVHVVIKDCPQATSLHQILLYPHPPPPSFAPPCKSERAYWCLGRFQKSFLSKI